ncbi:hypothetical protein SAMN05661044_01692 [Olivibacter domesticus]|uniref:Uncharacterized protein n=1 Tax=Olivibacter domesticus TaxID=407022 RepID=A0A1H7LJG2_OLID1|nr:hypothetical protein SAMN05661044_01692 [Olivibacter domesticus]
MFRENIQYFSIKFCYIKRFQRYFVLFFFLLHKVLVDLTNNLKSIILYELRNSIAKPGKAPLRRPIGIRQVKVTQPGEAIGLAFPIFSL